MSLTYVHVHQGNIRQNHKDPTLDLPVFTIKRGSKRAKPVHARSVRIEGPAELLYAGPGEPPILPCGARVVVRCQGKVTMA